MRTQISLYFADKGKYPSDLNALVDDSYLRSVPVDPITESADTWVTVSAEMDQDADISLEGGIADVFSGAPGQSLDGTSFREW